MTEPSVFTRIINGEIKQHILYQDDLCFVILTHEPITPGHCMVIPKEQIDSLWDVNDELYQHLMMISKKMAHKMEEAYDYKRIGMIVEGFGVPHAHIHVFGLDKALNPTIVDHMAKEHPILSPEELQPEADKFND
ncbi:MAG: Histidine triad family protein [Candidatus Saccharibacteria bacterium]|nr:Histidine triad family protein [Candidatus Saccharibacteria bacterium]